MPQYDYAGVLATALGLAPVLSSYLPGHLSASAGLNLADLPNVGRCGPGSWRRRPGCFPADSGRGRPWPSAAAAGCAPCLPSGVVPRERPASPPRRAAGEAPGRRRASQDQFAGTAAAPGDLGWELLTSCATAAMQPGSALVIAGGRSAMVKFFVVLVVAGFGGAPPCGLRAVSGPIRWLRGRGKLLWLKGSDVQRRRREAMQASSLHIGG